jgi:protein tyrosine phosphatase
VHAGKNRWRNVLPYDESRVNLTPLPRKPHTNYINANYIDVSAFEIVYRMEHFHVNVNFQGYDQEQIFIATQGPKKETVSDFWRLITQEEVSTILMLANLVEGGSVFIIYIQKYFYHS